MAETRELVSAYVRRFDGWTRLCEALAGALGVHAAEVIDLEADGDPVVFLSARTQHGDFALVMEAYIATPRAPGWRGRDALLRDLARDLDADLLYDDGDSPVPARWVLVRPGGERFEVFERSNGDEVGLRLDENIAPRRLST